MTPPTDHDHRLAGLRFVEVATLLYLIGAVMMGLGISLSAGRTLIVLATPPMLAGLALLMGGRAARRQAKHKPCP